VKSTTVVDLEGSYMGIDYGDLRLLVDGRKGYSIASVDQKATSIGMRSKDGKYCKDITCVEYNYSREGFNWNHGIRKRICGNTRRIAGKKEGWFETTLARAHNHALSQGHNHGFYEEGASEKALAFAN
jgi:hypothetical protein